ncbi:molybdate transport system substrate-binding protein [Geodermatophilus tzadiensis]|uniref:Molybdate transport system substrate-binding protein n=1 Tax=Geodermatophilus tzadiensis TaxID=1137988 RepID=A0A2T0T3H1_9ACTN|nr:molybdate ABC transporter substrate-binding protein [Geodermatophilus tzadiensis]PRY40207.1 molybdate transport system substrate-binding protein [Geodermatophilus tzadiensis]
MRSGRILAGLATLAVVVAGCGGGDDDAAASTAAASASGPTGTVTVFAAASLTDVFTDLGQRLEEEHDGLTVQFNFAGSSALATQLTQGAPADVFASANGTQMAVVTDAGLAEGEPAVFTANVLQIAVPAGNPAGVTGLADFGREDLTVAVCAPDVPCGAASADVFAAAGVTPRPDTLEEDVRAALTKVELGEVDAALVYTTDVVAAGDAVEGIAVPEAEDAVNDYPLCTLAAAPNPEGARAFVDLVRSEEGQQALGAAGFRAP